MESQRAESFSDGVFAVAITVLVFNLLTIADQTAHPRRGHTLAGDLRHDWPAYFAYVVSFLSIGIMWLNHHTLLAQVSKVNRSLLVLNLLLLMGIVAIPFPTALVADHLTGSTGSNGQATVAAVIYGLVMIVISVSFGSMWLYITAHASQLGARRPGGSQRVSTIRFTAGNAGYVVATLIALVSPLTSVIIYGLLAVYYLFEHLPEPTAKSDHAPGD